MTLPFTTEQFIQYFNIAIIAIVILFALIGMIRGTFKSIYYLIATIIIIGGGWMVSDKICNILLDVDLSQTGVAFPITSNEETITYTLTTLRETMTKVVTDQLFGGTAPTDTMALETVMAFVTMLLRVVYFIALIILSFTLFKIIFDIIWLIIKPRKKTKEGKKKKPSFVSRLGGLGVGAVKGMIYVLLVSFLFAGLASIANDLKNINESSDSSKYTVVLVNDTATLIKLSDSGSEESSKTNVLDEYSEIIDLLYGYKQTIAGEVFASIKIEETSLDEYVFDSLFSIKVKEEDTIHNIKLRTELSKVASALVKVPGILTGEFSMQTLADMDKDVLNEVVDSLTSLDLINVAIPVGVEIVLANEKILDGIENESLRSAVKSSLGDLQGSDINYNSEVKELGYVFVDAVQLLQFSDDGKLDIDFLSLDGDTIEAIFEKLSKLGIVDVVAPLAVEFLCSLDSLQSSFENLNINIDELIHPEKYDESEEKIKWSDEISNIGKVYKAFTNLGITSEDIEKMEFEFTDENIDAVDNLVDTIFNSRVISKAVPVLVDLGVSKMPEEYSEIITIPESIEWSDELKPLLKAALVLFSSGLLNDDESTDMTTKITNLEDSKIDQLALYLSQSTVIKTNLNPLIEKLLGPKTDEEGNVTNGVLGDITLKTLEDSEEWTQTEISSIFKALKVILNANLFNSEDIMKTFSELSDDTINDLASNLSASKFIRINLSDILTYFLDKMSTDEEELELVSLEENEWTKDELNAIFLSLKDIAGSGLMDSEGTDGIKNLSDETIDNLGTHISSSKFLTRNLTEVMDLLLSSLDLGEGIEIHGFENAEDWTKTEIVLLLKSARLLVNYTDDLTKIINLSEDDLDIIISSKLISNTLVSFIKEYTKAGKSLEVIKGTNLIIDNEWYDVDNDANFTIDGNILTITASTNADKYYIYVNGIKEISTTNLTYDLSTIESYTSDKVVSVKAKEYGEIRKLFISIQTLVGEDFNTSTLSDDIINNLTKLTDDDISTIIDSKIISETIICKIEEFASGDNAFISIPDGDLNKLNADGTKNREAWNESANGVHGELFKLLRAISVIFKGQDISSSSFTFTTDMITNISSSDIVKITDSLVINETIIKKIEDMANETSATIYIPTELLAIDNTIDRDKWQSANETKNLLLALKSIFNGSTVDTSNLLIEPIIDSKDEILKSLIITETIKKNIISASSGISTPSELSIDTLDGWKNTYDADGNILSRGEISALLGAITNIIEIDDTTTISTISTDNIKLNNVITNQDEILKSLVITNTVKDKITSFDGISIPSNEGLASDTLDGWKNTYNEDGTVKTHGEIASLLNSIKIVLQVNDATTLDANLSVSSIKLSNVITNQDEILKSIVITNTIKEKISSIDSIAIPEEELSKTRLDGWKNTYNEDGTLNKSGEISALLNALEIILSIDDTTAIDNFSVDNIKLGKVVYEKDEILKSLIITNTIKKYINDNATLDVPTSLSTSSLEGWKSTYDDNGNVTAYGEVAYLLTSIKYALNVSESDESNFNNINVNNITINNLASNRQTILHSKIITCTIKKQILNNASEDTSSILRLPASYEDSSSNNYIAWNNEYVDGSYNSTKKEFEFSVSSVGEIDKLLDAISELLTDTNVTFDSITSFNYANLFNETSQTKLIASKLISETIIQKVSENAINIPNDTSLGLNDNTDRTAWWNANGELKYFLNAIGSILTDAEKESMSVDLDVDAVYTKIIDESIREELFKSYIIAETLTVNFANLDLFSGSIPSVENAGIDLNAKNSNGTDDRSAWYAVTATVLSRSIEYKELWNLISSIDILLGDNFDTSVAFSIDQVLNNASFYPSLDDNKNNTNEMVGDLLTSKIIEEVFVGVVKKLVTNDGALASYLNVPATPNWYLYPTSSSDEYDTRTIIESIYQMQNAGLSYSAVSQIANTTTAGAASIVLTIAKLDTTKLADAFVISRTFNTSIEKFFNGMLEKIYGYAYLAGTLSGKTIESWDDVKLVQSDYDGLTRVNASALLKTNLDKIIENLKKVY